VSEYIDIDDNLVSAVP